MKADYNKYIKVNTLWTKEECAKLYDLLKDPTMTAPKIGRILKRSAQAIRSKVYLDKKRQLRSVED